VAERPTRVGPAVTSGLKLAAEHTRRFHLRHYPQHRATSIGDQQRLSGSPLETGSGRRTIVFAVATIWFGSRWGHSDVSMSALGVHFETTGEHGSVSDDARRATAAPLKHGRRWLWDHRWRCRRRPDVLQWAVGRLGQVQRQVTRSRCQRSSVCGVTRALATAATAAPGTVSPRQSQTHQESRSVGH